jgi:hypothetical protein
MRRFVLLVALWLLSSCGPVAGGIGSNATAAGTASPQPSASAKASQFPEARQGGLLFEDPISRHLLLVGGTTPAGAFVSSTWTWDGERWNQLSVLSEGIHVAFLDSVRNELIALQAAGPAVNRTASWSGKWSGRNSVHVPSPMSRGSGYAVFNPTSSNAVYCGIGEDSLGVRGLETWTWDGNDWSLRTGPSPARRLGYAFAYDPVTKTDVLFGGGPGGGPNPLYADTWQWNGTDWTQLQPVHSPSPGGAYATFDQSLNAIVLLDWHGDMWTWTGSDWKTIPSTSGGPGAPLVGAAFGYDPVSRGIIAFGGSTGGSASANTWRWGGASWVPVT